MQGVYFSNYSDYKDFFSFGYRKMMYLERPVLNFFKILCKLSFFAVEICLFLLYIEITHFDALQTLNLSNVQLLLN